MLKIVVVLTGALIWRMEKLDWTDYRQKNDDLHPKPKVNRLTTLSTLLQKTVLNVYIAGIRSE